MSDGAEHFQLNNNFRSKTRICEQVEWVLENDCNCIRKIGRTTSAPGEIVYGATLGDLTALDGYLAEGSVAFLSGMTVVLMSLLHVTNAALSYELEPPRAEEISKHEFYFFGTDQISSPMENQFFEGRGSTTSPCEARGEGATPAAGPWPHTQEVVVTSAAGVPVTCTCKMQSKRCACQYHPGV